MNRTGKKRLSNHAVALAGFAVVLILILGTWWMGSMASRDTERVVRSVSLFYLEELAGRREQVVASNLQSNIRNIEVAVGLMDPEDLSGMENLQAFQRRMKQLYDLDKFAFVDANGLIYTSQGTQTDIDSYAFDYRTLSGPEISIKDPGTDDQKVIIAVPADHIPFLGEELVVCFEEIDMRHMLEGVSLQSEKNETTFCNLYSFDGTALTNVVLGGLARENNLLEAMRNARFQDGYSYEQMVDDFASGREGVVSFVYGSYQETLYYVPVEGADWMLTYLIRESLIGEQISAVSNGIIQRSTLQTALTAIILFGIFALTITQTHRNARLQLEKETSEAAGRARQQELEERLKLQDQLLQEEKHRVEQDRMITALASDYRSVYYVDLDADESICYRVSPSDSERFSEGDHFPYRAVFTDYAEHCVDEKYREEFLRFIEPDAIREGLTRTPVLSFRYLAHIDGRDRYEMLRMAAVRSSEERADDVVRIVGAGFTDVDGETRDDMARRQALTDALNTAEEASRAKTAFLSNMSHEIRTPMNAIIGLDSIALSEPGLTDSTRDHLEKIGASAQHLLNIINDILDMSRIESGKTVLKAEEFSFSRLIEQINAIFSEQCAEKGLHYTCRVLGSVDDRYIGDSMKLRQVIINILGNAVKFTPEGGEVVFSVERTAQFDNHSTLLFTFRDTGIGMSEEFLPKLFDTFSQEDSSSTSRYGSTGLGLAITRNLVEMMNGKIEVESKKGVGTTFRVTVTLMDSKASGPASALKELRPQEMSVLIVDDDQVAADHAKLVLEKVGICSEIAHSGAQAVEMVRLRHARREPFNLILVDWKMPEMDGVETTRRIREIVGSDSAIIILTAYKWDDIFEEATAAGVDGFLAKPLFPNNVLQEFSQALEKRELAAAGRQTGVADLRGRRILLAEDVPVNAEIIIMLLGMREIQVDHAENGKKAVELFAAQPEGTYDAILMDMRMPEMDGLEATAAIRAMDRADAKRIPIIALTANAFDEDVQRSLQAGLNAHLSKPVEPDSLFGTLEGLIQP